MMGRVETVDASGLVNLLGRQELQKPVNEAMPAPKWLGSPLDKADVEIIGTSPTRSPIQKAENSHWPRNSNPSVPKEVKSVRSKAQQTSLREPLPQTGGSTLRGEDKASGLFKKEFIEKLTGKVKERPGYLLANEDFSKPLTTQPKLFTETDEAFVKPPKANLKLKQIEDDIVRPVKAQPKLFEPTESSQQPRSFARSPNSRKDILGQTLKIFEPSGALARSASLEKRTWMSKSEKLKLDECKQSWSKDIEDTSKEFILNKFFQSPSRRTASDSVYDAFPADEEAPAEVDSSRRRMLPRDNKATQQTKSVPQQNRGQMTVQSEKIRTGQDIFSDIIKADHDAQIHRNVSKPSTGSPGRRLSSEETRKDLLRSPGRKLSAEEKRNYSSGSSGSRSSSEERRKDSRKSPATRLSSDEGRKDSLETSIRSIKGVLASEELRAGNKGMQSDCGRSKVAVSDNESQCESGKQKKLTMVKSLKKAVAVDQAHFLRALQDNGAVQSSERLCNDMNGDPAANDAIPRRPSSPNGRKNLREVRRDFPNEARESRSREPSPTARREVAFGSTIRSREPSPTGRRDAAGSLTRSREPSPSRREATYGSCGSPIHARTNSLKKPHSCDSLSEKSSSVLHSDAFQRNRGGARSPSGSNSPSDSSPQLSRQSSSRSIEIDENESISGGSMIEKLKRKASLRKSKKLAENQTISSSVPGSPNHRVQPLSSESKLVLRRTLTFVNLDADTSEARLEFESRQTSRASSPTSCRTPRRNSIEPNLPTVQQLSGSERRNSISRVTSVSVKSSVSAPVQQHPLNNSLRVNVPAKESTIAKLKSRSSASLTAKTIDESCRPIATPQRTVSTAIPVGSPSSPGSDDSGSEGSGSSGIEQPSPVSVLSYKTRRTPFQEESRLSPLELKLHALHERIRKSKADVSNQKIARLEKIKETEAQLSGCVVTELNIEALLKAKELKTPTVPTTPQVSQAPQLLLLPAPIESEDNKPSVPQAPTASQLLPSPALSDTVEKRPLAHLIASVKDGKPENARPAPTLDCCTSLETLDLKSILPWAENHKWDLVYIRDVLLASRFGRDKYSMTKWYSTAEPMDPCLCEELEEFYRFGKKFSGSAFLFAESRERCPAMQAHVQRIFFDPGAEERANVDTMNRCFIFDVVNETLAKKLAPYVAPPRPWIKPLAKPIVRPRPTGSALMQEIWTDIYDQIGNNGSMSMDKAQLHQSLENLISEDLFKRTDLFPTREVERTAERIATDLERRILDDLLLETISSLRNLR